MEFTTLNYPQANYLSSNHKIKMPIFSIHGNHDDVVGLDLFSSLDQLNANSYINYFGKVTDIDKISVTPILMLKGMTKLAIFGIGHIKDARFNLSFEREKIEFNRPVDNQGKVDETWFSILVLH